MQLVGDAGQTNSPGIGIQQIQTLVNLLSNLRSTFLNYSISSLITWTCVTSKVAQTALWPVLQNSNIPSSTLSFLMLKDYVEMVYRLWKPEMIVLSVNYTLPPLKRL